MDVSTPEHFIKLIPRTVKENLEFRENLNLLCSADEGFKNLFLDLCSKSPQIMYDCLYWACNHKETADRKILPFITRRKQIVAINTLSWCIDNQHDYGTEKSRCQGATEQVKELVRRCLFKRNCNFIVGSLKKEDVDNRPDPTTIFAKIDNAVEMLPDWFEMKAGVDYERKDMVIHFKKTNSVIKGETTNENFSISKRADAVFLDEFGREPHRIAESIEGSVRDVSDCIIYNSTHWFGLNHPFNLAINRPTTKKVTLFWYENEEQMKGAYTSPREGVIELIDEDYYRQNYPEFAEEYMKG